MKTMPAISRVRFFRPLLACAFIATFFSLASIPALGANLARRKHMALEQYHRALEMREELNQTAETQRSSEDYDPVIEAFRKVYHVAPTSTRADASAFAVGELLAEQAEVEGDTQRFKSAIGQYEFLCREYPGSRYRFQALLNIGEIYAKDLGDTETAKATFEDFLKRYPQHPLAGDAKAALAEINHPSEKEEATENRRVGKADRSERGRLSDRAGEARVALTASNQHQGPARITSLRYWSTDDDVRIAIDLGSEVKYEAGRVPSPDRIFFDLQDSRLSTQLIGKTYDVNEGALKKIRIAQYKPKMARIVLEVDKGADYSAFLLPNPYRLIIDVRSRQAPTAIETASTHSSPESDAERSSIRDSEQSKANLVSREAARSRNVSLPSRGEISVESRELDAWQIEPQPLQPMPVVARTSPSARPEADHKSSRPDSSVEQAFANDRGSTNRRKPGTAKVHEAIPTGAGDLSLTRALGLKIGKIVIDAGHGGHDTGTIGPNGLLEKDLVLDVALRLGRLLEQKLGAEVVYTRQDDTFIPLTTRTAIANENQADLFISIHANSSHDMSARGVETYYLNFTRSADALEVAARENADADTSIHELQDLVKKIALKEKIDESREFAATVQHALYAGEAAKSPGLRDRGVKKAPFVVLIGANMPSILAEISFISNPTDERKLRTPEYRQRIAESLYRGIARYTQGLSGIKVASAKAAISAGQ
jgi:N-acetylmuramoyl-L-alanine amidase